MDTSSEIDWTRADELQEWERGSIALMQRMILDSFETGEEAAEQSIRATYIGTGRLGDLAPKRLQPDDAKEEILNAQVTAWRLRWPDPESVTISTRPNDEGAGESMTVPGDNAELLKGWSFVRPGAPSSVLLGAAAMWCRGFQAGKQGADQPTRKELRRQLRELLEDALNEMPTISGAVGHGEKKIDVKSDILERLETVRDELGGDTYHVDLPPFTIEIEEESDRPGARRDTPEFAPDPFQGEGETAGILSGPLSSAVARSLVETPDEADSHPGDYEQEWGADSTGHPIRVEELGGQYSGRVTLRVQAYGEPDPTAVDAEMGWAMLQEMEMEEVWLHAFLLAHASAPGRRGEREVIRIPRTQIERLPMGFRSRNRGKWERAEKIKEHIDRLRSVFVQFQNVERHGNKLRFRHDMNATPLWSLRMVAEGEKDLFTGEEWSEWYLEAREGMWAEEFLHNHGKQWAPLPKEWFEQIDRRGSDWGQRLAVLLLFLFRTNRKQGGRVKLSAAKMLQACGVDLSLERDSSDRYDLKQKLSSALEDLHHNYGMRVQDEDVNVSKIDGRSYWTSWKNQTVTIDPPEKIDHQLLSGGGPERNPLPDTRPGRWSKRQIEQLLERLGWTQKQLAKNLPVGKQSVSHYLNDRRTPSDEVRAALDRIQARHL
jgi:DNA-binding XRE family transcriptional regulator